VNLKRILIAVAVALVAVAALLWVAKYSKKPRANASQQTFTEPMAGPPWIYPDPGRTPGAANPDITQSNIRETICNHDWSTQSIRPPALYTSKLKRQQMSEWKVAGSPTDYEEDHLISLELGGSPTDPRNLWPEAYNPKPGAREKDVVENYLHKQVCAGTMTLSEAQQAIATDWYRVYLRIH